MTTDTAQRYPYLDGLMMGFINQDAAEMAGSTRYEDMIQYYLDEVDPDTMFGVLADKRKYQEEYPDNLTETFAKDFPYGYKLSNVENFFSVLENAIALRVRHIARNRNTDQASDSWDCLKVTPQPQSEKNAVTSNTATEFDIRTDELEGQITNRLVLQAKLAEKHYGRGSQQHLQCLETLAHYLGSDEGFKVEIVKTGDSVVTIIDKSSSLMVSYDMSEYASAPITEAKK